MPAVQNATAAVKDTASGVAESAKSTVTEKTSARAALQHQQPGRRRGPGHRCEHAAAHVEPSAPPPAPGSGTSTGTTTTTPDPGTMAGASASKTAPDITRP
jgi:hypothetical protein